MDCKIMLRWTFRNHLNELHNYQETFLHLPDFRNFLRWGPDKANQLGYGERTLTQESRNSNVKLSLRINGKEIHFENADKFGEFLRGNPDIAKALQL